MVCFFFCFCFFIFPFPALINVIASFFISILALLAVYSSSSSSLSSSSESGVMQSGYFHRLKIPPTNPTPATGSATWNKIFAFSLPQPESMCWSHA